jgi:hypothetical protein
MKTTIVIILLFISQQFFAQDFSKNKIPCEPVVYPIQFYYVLNHPLRFQRNIDFLTEVKDTLNRYFEPMCIQFQICKIDTIYDYNYFVLDDEMNTTENKDIRAMYYNPKAINIYSLNLTIPTPPTETFRGICDEKSKKPYIFLYATNMQTVNKVAICVQMYRYFGLDFTASFPGSVEFVNGVNGQVTADSTWDTPADPGYIGFSSPDTFVLPNQAPLGTSYVFTNRKDPNGDYYNPMVLNPMSIYNDLIREAWLTHEQYQKIITTERKCRKRFWELE